MAHSFLDNKCTKCDCKETIRKLTPNRYSRSGDRLTHSSFDSTQIPCSEVTSDDDLDQFMWDKYLKENPNSNFNSQFK